jgi:REP element-mobilizing transposase RayT
MATFTQLLYQIVFSTKERENTLSEENREQLFRFIWGILKNKKCTLYRINGVNDHLHIATHIHPTISLASIVKDIKVSSAI